MMPTFEEQLAAARRLPNKELERHAAVAKLEGLTAQGDTGKRCLQCFCCAAEAVLEDRKKRGTDLRFYTAKLQGALGISTHVCLAEDVEDFHRRYPHLEMTWLGVFRTETDAHNAIGGACGRTAILAKPPQERTYRVIWVRDDKGTRGVHAPGPFTHDEACTVLSKLAPHPLRRDLVEEIEG